MPTSPTGRGTDRANPGRGGCRTQAGLTLIELVVVVAILGLLAMPAMLRFGGGGLFGGTPPAQRVAAQLQADLTMMRDRALFSRQTLGLTPTETGWAWLNAGAGSVGQAEGAGGEARGLVLNWQIAGRGAQTPEPGDAPRVTLLPDGRATPFEVRIGSGAEMVVCRFDGWGDLSCAGP